MHASTLSLCIHISSQEFFGNYILELCHLSREITGHRLSCSSCEQNWTYYVHVWCSQERSFSSLTLAWTLSVVAGWPLVWKTWKCRRINSFQRNVRKVSGKNLVRENCLLANFMFSRPLWATLYCFDNFAVYKIIVNIFAEHALTFIVYW